MKGTRGEIVVDQHLRLVPRHPDDAPEMFALIEAERPALREWLTWIDASDSVEDVRRYARFVQSQFAQNAGFEYAIRFDGASIGGIGLHNLEPGSESAHVGYWLSPAARGRGLMTRAVAALTTYAFTELGVHRLEIRVVVENSKSRAVAERLGYRFEGILRESYLLHGRFRDLAVYAMVAGDWPAALSRARLQGSAGY